MSVKETKQKPRLFQTVQPDKDICTFFDKAAEKEQTQIATILRKAMKEYYENHKNEIEL